MTVIPGRDYKTYLPPLLDLLDFLFEDGVLVVGHACYDPLQ